MDLRQLTTFRAVYELGSLSKASDRLHVAQPALSRQIKLLEHDLRTALFIRHGRGMVPTETGKMLFERTAGLVRRLEQVREDILASAGSPSGRVVVGMVPTISGPLAAALVSQVAQSYPLIELRIVDAYGGYLVEWLHRGEIDLAVTYGLNGKLHLADESLRRDELCVVGAAGSGIGETPVQLGDISKFGVVLPSPPHGLRLLVDEYCARIGVELDLRVEADSYQALIDIVSAGIGVTFLPYYSVSKMVSLKILEAAPLRPKLERELVLAQPSLENRSLATMTVTRVVRDAVSALP